MLWECLLSTAKVYEEGGLGSSPCLESASQAKAWQVDA